MVYDSFQDWCYCGANFSIVCVNNSKRANLRNIDNIKGSNGKKIDGFEFLGMLPAKWYLMAWGNPGGGKSTFCLKLISKLAQRDHRRLFLYWSCEEGFSDSLSYKIKTWGITEKNIFFSVAENLKDFQLEIEKYNPGCVCIDSINRSGLKSKDLVILKEELSMPLIAICHITKNNKHKGTSDLPHDTEINIEVKDGLATVIKNRYGPSGKTMKIFDKQTK